MEMSDRENRSVLCSAAQGKESGFPQERWERLPGEKLLLQPQEEMQFELVMGGIKILLWHCSCF